MNCPSCSALISDTAKFCPECGEKIVRKTVCPDCGTEVAPGAKFCAECGHKFALPSTTRTPHEKAVDEGKDEAILDKWGKALVRQFLDISSEEFAVILDGTGRNDPRALFAYGVCLEQGCAGLEKSPGHAMDVFRRSAAAGHAPAQNILGNRLELGKIVPSDHEEALSWWRKAADGGFPVAAVNWAWAMYVQTGDRHQWHLEKDRDALVRMADEMNDPRAQVLMGDYYSSVETQDLGKAASYFLSASQSSDIAIRRYALVGLGMSRLQMNDQSGLQCLEKASGDNFPLASALLAYLYYSDDMGDDTREEVGNLICSVIDSDLGKRIGEMVSALDSGKGPDPTIAAADRMAYAVAKVVAGRAALDGVNPYDLEPATVDPDQEMAIMCFREAAILGCVDGLRFFRRCEETEIVEESIDAWKANGNPWIYEIDSGSGNETP